MLRDQAVFGGRQGGWNFDPLSSSIAVWRQLIRRRTPAKINPFRYFVKEIMAVLDPCNRVRKKKQLETIVRKMRDNSVGRADYSTTDFVEDVTRACAREAVAFDNDLFNELAG